VDGHHPALKRATVAAILVLELGCNIAQGFNYAEPTFDPASVLAASVASPLAG
jgi:hypothetical protein